MANLIELEIVPFDLQTPKAVLKNQT